MEGIQAKIKAVCRAKRRFSLRPRRVGEDQQNKEDDNVVGVNKALEVLIKTQGQCVSGNLQKREIPFEQITKNGVTFYIVGGEVYEPNPDKPSATAKKEPDKITQITKEYEDNTTQELPLNSKAINQEVHVLEEDESSLFVHIISEHSYSTNVSSELFNKHLIEEVTSAAQIYRQFLTTKPSMHFQQLDLKDNEKYQRIIHKKPKSMLLRFLQTTKKRLTNNLKFKK